MLGKVLRIPADCIVKTMSKSWALCSVVDSYATRSVFKNKKLFNEFLRHSSSDELDWYYAAIRRKLTADIKWRYGAKRINDVSGTIVREFLKYTDSISGKYCEIGCGDANPFGMSTLMYLHGASSAICFDKVDIDKKRVSESLFDLISDCSIFEDSWLCSGELRNVFRDKLRNFDMASLASGDLASGLRSVPLDFYSTVFSEMDIQSESIDYLSSWVVLEHMVDLEASLTKMLSWITPKGLAFHLVDLRDHRYYANPKEFHQWSFLTEEECPRPSEEAYFLNTIRTTELKKLFQKCGYEILEYHNRMEQPPRDIRLRLHRRFADLTDEDIMTTSVLCLLRKA